MARPKRKKRPLILIDTGRSGERFWMAFTDAAREYEWRLFDVNMINRELPADMKPDGFVGPEFADDPLITDLRSRGCLCIRIGSFPHPMDEELPAILPDREAGGRMAAEHFATRGYKHVGQIISEPRANPDRLYEGFLEKASELGMEMHLLKRQQGLGFKG
jgi:DNA-binding LacI/PurR family transcriptional regulator